jgi:nucleoid-associated protein YgaU
MMGKEVKIGLSIIAVLLCVFGGVLFMRLRGGKDATPPVTLKKSADKQTSDKQDGKEDDKPKKPKLDLQKSGSGSELKFGERSPLRPTIENDRKEDRYASSRNAPEENSDNGWSESSDRSVPVESPPEPAPPAQRYADRYGDRYASDDGLGSLPAAPRYADKAGSETESLAMDDAAAPGAGGEKEQPLPAALPLGAPGGQPIDGYEVAEEEIAEEENRALNRAGGDPFPPAPSMASPQRSAYAETDSELNHGLASDREASTQRRVSSDRSVSSDREPLSSFDRTPKGDSFDTVGNETPLTPISEPRGAAYGENELPDRESMAGDYRESPAGTRFSPVSSRQPTSSVAAEDRETESGDFPNATYAGGEQDARPLNGAYFVQPNDSFATISKKLYGTEAYFQALHEYNREHFPNPDLLNVGDQIEAPDAAVLQQTYPQLCPKPRNTPSGRGGGNMMLASQGSTGRGGRRYLVADGDTLFHIAKRELGKASRWKEIYELNQDQLGEDFNYLSPGMELRLPGEAGARPDPVADRLTPSRFRR